MIIKNTKNSYGIVTILLHWLMAILIIGLFILGVVMVDLDYYSKWYVAAPWWHKSIGMAVLALLFVRMIWIFSHVQPMPLVTYKSWEIKVAKIAHYLFYILLLVICISGYFITTAKGAAIDMFGWFSIPAVVNFSKYQADIAGEVHEIVAYVMAFLFVLHVCATFKHHFFDKDVTLSRILKPGKQEKNK